MEVHKVLSVRLEPLQVKDCDVLFQKAPRDVLRRCWLLTCLNCCKAALLLAWHGTSDKLECEGRRKLAEFVTE